MLFASWQVSDRHPSCGQSPDCWVSTLRRMQSVQWKVLFRILSKHAIEGLHDMLGSKWETSHSPGKHRFSLQVTSARRQREGDHAERLYLQQCARGCRCSWLPVSSCAHADRAALQACNCPNQAKKRHALCIRPCPKDDCAAWPLQFAADVEGNMFNGRHLLQGVDVLGRAPSSCCVRCKSWRAQEGRSAVDLQVVS